MMAGPTRLHRLLTRSVMSPEGTIELSPGSQIVKPNYYCYSSSMGTRKPDARAKLCAAG
jgi:hypothetical protein